MRDHGVSPLSEMNMLQKLIRALTGLSAGESIVPAMKLQVLGDSQRSIEGIALRRHAEQLLDLLGRRGGIDAVDHRVARGGRYASRHQSDNSGLTRAIGSQ